MIDRRKFLQTTGMGVVSTAFPSLLSAASQATASLQDISGRGYGPLQKDPKLILDLPRNFQYQVISVMGQKMEDGLIVPGWPDGMHAYALDRERVVVMCNHELDMSQSDLSCWKGAETALLNKYKSKTYDQTRDGAIAPSGVRRFVYNLRSRKLERQHMALAGTLRNCSGGATPWNSWISCEESVRGRGEYGLLRSHGYCFDIPVNKSGMHKAAPIKAMGRFNHEAALVDPETGIVYLTEDRPDSLFYRYIPKKKGQLSKGGKLQALVVRDAVGPTATGNLNKDLFPVQHPVDVLWVDLEDVDSADDSLRKQGFSKDAAIFVRGEGMTLQHTEQGPLIWIMCTSGGAKGLGQIFNYRPSVAEGTSGEDKSPGQLTLFSEPNNPELLKHGDNLAIMPNGDLLVCEDHQEKQRLIGVTPEGEYYVFARNVRGLSEFTGATFSPDGSTLFVNLQQQNGTVAITGPWLKTVKR